VGDQRAPRGSAQIEKRVHSVTGAVRYYGRYTEADGRRRHVLLSKVSLDEARKNLRSIMARVDAGRAGREIETPEDKAKHAITVRELAEKFRAEAQRDVWDLEAYRDAFWSAYECNVDPYIGTMCAADVTRRRVAAWRDQMKGDGKNTPTILRGRATASVMWNWALELGHLPDDAHNPIEGVSWPSYKPEAELYTEMEVAQLFAEAANTAPELLCILAFAYFTGCRKGELAALRWGDVRFDTNSINVHRSFKRDARKSGKPVVVGLHAQLRAILEPLAQEDPEALVFPDPRTGKMRPEHDHKHGCWGIRPLAKRAKVPRLRNPWHGFRKSHATALEEAGATPSDIMRALGQSSIEVAMRYANASPKRAAERVAAIRPVLALVPAEEPAKAAHS